MTKADSGTYPSRVTIRRALDLSEAATVRTADGRLLRMRLMVGWESPTTNWLDEAAASGRGSVIESALAGAGIVRDAVRALRYRFQRRQDWWLVRDLDNEAPLARLHPDRASATQQAEHELQAAVAAGGRYLPYGE